MADQGPAGADRTCLDARALFRLACREAYKDQKIEPDENQFLKDLYRLLALPPETAKELAREVKAEIQAGKGVGSGALSGPVVLGEACRLAWSDGKVQADEMEILGKLGELLGMRQDEVRELVRAGRPTRPRVGGGAALVAREPEIEIVGVDKGGTGESGGGEGERPRAAPLPPDTSSAVSWLAMIGASCMGLGALAMVAAHWDDIPQPLKTAGMFLMLAVLYVVAYERCLVDHWAPTTGEGMVLAGGILFGAGIWRCADLNPKPDPHAPSAVLIWCVGLLPMVLTTRSSQLRFLMLLLLLIWNVMEQGSAGHALPWLAAILPPSARAVNPVYFAVAGLCGWPAIRAFPSAAGTALLLVSTGLWFLIPVLVSNASTNVHLDLLVCSGLALIALVWLSKTGVFRLKELEGGWDTAGLLGVLFFSWVGCFGTAAHDLAGGVDKFLQDPASPWFLPVGFHLAVLGLATVLAIRVMDRYARLPAACLAASSLVACYPWLSQGSSGVGCQLAYNLIYVAMSMCLAFLGVIERSTGVLNLGVAALAFWVLCRYIEFYQNLGGAGSALMVGGAVLLTGAGAIERLRRSLLENMRSGGGW